MLALASLLSGLVSGLANPAKVLGFLDLAGRWDPSLMLVMGGAISVGSVAFAVARRRAVSWLGVPIKLPTAQHIDRRLVIGSLLFGVGWGIAGLCPGPALVALASGQAKAAVFFAAMLAGMGAFEWLEQRKARLAPGAACVACWQPGWWQGLWPETTLRCARHRASIGREKARRGGL